MQDSHDPANIYLENEVFTATPARLRLMLIQAALRHAHQVVTCWEQGDLAGGQLSLVRAQEIVSELQTSIRGSESQLAQTVAALYVVLYCDLVEAQLDSDIQRVKNVILGLKEERETWQQYCAIAEEAPPESESASNSVGRENMLHESHASESSSITPHFDCDLAGSEGLSIEA